MSWAQGLWLTVSLIFVAAVLLLSVALLRKRAALSGRSTPASRIAALVALVTSAAILTSIAARVRDLGPRLTFVDVGALAVTGILTGVFLVLSVGPASTNATKG